MEIFNLIKCEFIKNFSIKKIILIFISLILICFGIIKIDEYANNWKYTYGSYVPRFASYESYINRAKEEYESNNNFVSKIALDIFKKVNKLIDYSDGEEWKLNAFNMIERNIHEEVAIDYLINHYKDPKIKEVIDKRDGVTYSDDNYESTKSEIVFILKKRFDKPLDELKKELEDLRISNENYIEALKNNLYYKYVTADCHRTIIAASYYSIDEKERIKEYCDYMEKEKIESQYDYRAINAIQSSTLYFYIKNQSEDMNPKQLEHTVYELNSDKSTLRYVKRDLEEATKAKNITYYAFKNNLKHDLSYTNENVDQMGYYKTSKTVMNNGLHLGVAILLVIIITNAGIMSSEHDKGTIKLLLTKPVKRYKILLSKLLYLIIETFVIWLIASLILFFISGFTCGFKDLFTSKIISSGDTAKEVNYILWYIKEIILGMIPLTFFITLLFSLSTITLSTSATSGIAAITTFFGMLIWPLISGSRAYLLSPLNYTPLPWVNYRMVTSSGLNYLRSISLTPLNDSYGLIISIIGSVLLFLLTVYVYNKKDIKN